MSGGQAPELVIDGRVATVTLRRPSQANRLEVEDLQRLLEHFDRVDADPEVLVAQGDVHEAAARLPDEAATAR